MSHVFISYSKKNQSYARKLADELMKFGFDVWIDDRIDYGEHWWKAIIQAIRDCTAFIVIMTPESEESQWVDREVALANQWNRPIFPLLLAGENWPLFVLTQYANVSDGKLPQADFFTRLGQYVTRREVGGEDVTSIPQKKVFDPARRPETELLSDVKNFQNAPYKKSWLIGIILFGVMGIIAISAIIGVLTASLVDPIQGKAFEAIPIRLIPDEGLLITDFSQNVARAIIRVPRSQLEVLNEDRIEIWADLTGLGSGVHTVPLQAKSAVADIEVAEIQPNNISVSLEQGLEKQVPLRATIIREPSVLYDRDEPVFDMGLTQALISGPESKVRQVVEARAEFDLSEQRSPVEQDVRLTPVDADGNPVEVTIEPQIVHARVNIQQREDVREIPARPNILVNTLSEDYFLSSISYSPQTILVSGSPSALATLPSTFYTAPIDLTGRREDFEVTVAVEVSDSEVMVLSDQNVNVTIGIVTLITSRQFDGLPIEMIGLREGLSAQLTPSEVTVLVTGPAPIMRPLSADDIQVVVDLNDLDIGTYSMVPVVSIAEGQLSAEDISILPADLDVEITAQSGTTTAEPDTTSP